ncbi:MAG: hypothetical protein HZA54_12695 [Planctomycetes bacterium]|nr:hypothetical protein [Planctomycetota bacterium]
MTPFVRSALWMVAAGLFALPLAAQEAPPAGADAPAPAIGGAAAAEEAMNPETSGLPATSLVTVEWKDKPLPEVLEHLSRLSGVNVIPTPGLEDRVTETFTNLPWREALDTVMLHTGCVADEVSAKRILVSKPPRVTMEFDKAPLDKVINIIAKYAGASIVISEFVKGEVTMRFSNVPWRNALDSVVKTAGYATVQEPNEVIRVVRPEDLQAQLETRMFRMRFLRPPPTFKGSIKTSYAVGETKATTDPVKEFTLLKALSNMLSKSVKGVTIGTLEFDLPTNTIIVTDTKPVLDEMAKMIARLDIEPDQVLIECRFITTANEELSQFGINLLDAAQNQGFTASTKALAPFNPGLSSVGDQAAGTPSSAASPSGAPLTPFGVLNGMVTSLPFGLGHSRQNVTQFFLTQYDVTATLRLFEQDTASTVLQAPQLMAVDNQEATIFVGETIRYPQVTSQSDSTGNITFTLTEASNSPVQTGFQLMIIPHIVREVNSVMLTVIPQNQSLSGRGTGAGLIQGFERFTIQTGNQVQIIDLPRIATSTVVTRMLLESGQTGVIGGLVEDRETKITEKVPFLGDIPGLGWLFKQKRDQATKSHLIIFVTARIIKGAKETALELRREAAVREARNTEEWEKTRAAGEDAATMLKRLDERRRQQEAEFEGLKQ